MLTALPVPCVMILGTTTSWPTTAKAVVSAPRATRNAWWGKITGLSLKRALVTVCKRCSAGLHLSRYPTSDFFDCQLRNNVADSRRLLCRALHKSLQEPVALESPMIFLNTRIGLEGVGNEWLVTGGPVQFQAVVVRGLRLGAHLGRSHWLWGASVAGSSR
jgi:hypothetical protein